MLYNFHVFNVTRLFCEQKYTNTIYTNWGFYFPAINGVVIWNKTIRLRWNGNAEIDYVDTCESMEKLLQIGRVRTIGISNFNSEQADRELSIATIKSITNQIIRFENAMAIKDK